MVRSGTIISVTAMRLIMFGSFDATVHPRVAVLAEGLSRRGHDVLYCNVPLRLSTATRVAMLRQGWRLARLILELVRSWVALVVRAWRLPPADAVIIGYMGHFDVHLARLLFPRTPIVLDHLISASDTARDRGEHGRVKLAMLDAIDRAALAAADLVLVDTEEHRQRLPAPCLSRTVVVAVGAPGSWFRAADARAQMRRRTGASRGEPLKVVFFGLYTPLQGAVVISTALAMLQIEPISVTMIGDGQDRAAAAAVVRGGPSVRWVDWVDHERLPQVVADHDVCLGIFGNTPKARRVVPNKVFQGAAAGCVVVTSSTAPQRAALGDAALFVPPGDASALADALRRLARDSEAVDAMAATARRHARAHFSSPVVVAPLVKRLEAMALRRAAS
jgi:glycosyltransferase involved in cell wall biosynthesis